MATDLAPATKKDELQLCYDFKRDLTTILSELQRKINRIADIPKSQSKVKRDLRSALCGSCREKSHEILNLPLLPFSNVGCQTVDPSSGLELSKSNEEFLNQMLHILIENERLRSTKSGNEDNEDQNRRTKEQTAVQPLPTKGLDVNKGTRFFKYQEEQRSSQNEMETATSGEISKLTSENNELQTQISKLTSEKDELQTQISKLTPEKDELQTQISKLTSEKDELQTQISKLTSEKDEMQSNLETQQIAIGKLRTTLEMKAQETDGVKKARDTYHHQQRGLQQDRYQKTADASSDGDSPDVMQSSSQSQEKAHSKETKSFTLHSSSTIETIQTLQSENDRLVAEGEKLQHEITEIKNHLTEANNELHGTWAENTRLKEDFKRLKQEEQKLLRVVDDLNNKVKQTESELKQVQSENKTLINTEDEQREEKEKLRDQIKELSVPKRKRVVIGLRGERSGLDKRLIDIVTTEMTRHLQQRLDEYRLNLTISFSQVPSDVTNGLQVVLCKSVFGTGTNISEPLKGCKADRDMFVMVIHLTTRERISSLTPTSHGMIGNEARHCGGILDMACSQDSGLYDCGLNNTAIDKMASVIRTLVIL